MEVTHEKILDVQDLTIRLQIAGHPVTVVDKLSFSLHRGKTLALVGESGCGKTLTALSLLKLIPSPPALAIEGSAYYRGDDLVRLSDKELRSVRGSKISMIFQDPTSALNPVYKVGIQLMEAAQAHLLLDDEEAEARAVKALIEVGIPHPMTCMQNYPHQLSGGMRQRVMIAMALICEPDVLIADEPTTALDVTIQAQVLELIRALQKKNGMAVLLITHDMGVVAESADDVIVMYAGQEAETAPIHTLFDNMAHPYTQGLFRSRPNPKDNGKRLQAIKGNVPTVGNYPKGCRFHPRCPYVMKKCEEGQVPNFVVGEAHHSRCLLWDGTEESQEGLRKFHS